MASSPNSKATNRSRQTRKNLYDRLEDARNRRAEVLAHKPAANDIARRPVDVSRDDPEPQLARFPKIVMPSTNLPEADIALPERRTKSPIFVFSGLIVAAVLVVLIATPSGTGPQPSAAVAALETPLGDDASVVSPATSSDMPLRREEKRRLSAIALPRALPPQGLTGPQPQALVGVENARPPSAIDTSEALLFGVSAVKRAQNATFPLAPVNELPFTFDMPVTLRVSLNIPVQSSQSDINAVLRALEQSRHEVGAPRSVNFVVRDTQVRFFHQSDAQAATELAGDIGGIARDFTDFSPTPPDGLVEVYVSGRNQPARPPAAPRGVAGDIRQLTEDIGNALRSITR
ncbi:MAG: hypothetical protein HKN27_06805 [Silicimonas sp.]|nr:hypothetical protein [Silicimonas sp.]